MCPQMQTLWSWKVLLWLLARWHIENSQLYWDLQYVMDELMENGEQNALTKHARTLKDLCLSEDILTEKDLHYRSMNLRPQ